MIRRLKQILRWSLESVASVYVKKLIYKITQKSAFIYQSKQIIKANATKATSLEVLYTLIGKYLLLYKLYNFIMLKLLFSSCYTLKFQATLHFRLLFDI